MENNSEDLCEIDIDLYYDEEIFRWIMYDDFNLYFEK